ncbi:MAG TPA: hypothetical protein VGS96_07485 [Thermoanaerobaculia bacterium]|jgi:hypothetical protein|nr:hypothetical protein [Thermoanaerobaculia bacterium]
MKRAIVATLVLSLCALPLFAKGEPLTSARCVSLEHVQGGWRMEIKCDQGAGAISLMDAGQYRGEGVFAKWSQEQMRSTYGSLIPKESGPAFELMQLG